MGKEFLTFADVEMKKEKIYSSKSAVHVENLNIDKIVISHACPCIKRSPKYLISYQHNELHRYVSCFQIWEGIWNMLKMLRQCIFWLRVKNYWQNTKKYTARFKKWWQEKKSTDTHCLLTNIWRKQKTLQ